METRFVLFPVPPSFMFVPTGVAFFFLSLLSLRTAGQLVSADAKCDPGFEWLYTSKNQTPCDVAQALGRVCVADRLNVTQLGPGNVYLGPYVGDADSCRCSSVYYSLLSACAYCQHHSYILWSAYNRNCSTTSVSTFPQPIPLLVTVLRWAYQDVSTKNMFDVNIANSTDKSEGPPPSGQTSTSSPSSTGYTSGNTSDSKIGIIAASVGGLVGLTLIGGIVAFCLLRRRKRSSKTDTKLEPVSMNFNRPPEVTRPTIPGFSAPNTPFVPSAALHPTPHYHVSSTESTSPHGYAMSVGGTSEIYETSPVLFSNVGERYRELQNTSFAIPATTAYYDPQVPVTTDNYWTQTTTPSVAHSHPATDQYSDSPLLSTQPTLQSRDSRYNDARSTRQSIQSSVVSSSQTNQGTALTSTESRVNLLPPAYADIVDGAPRRILPEKQGL